MSFRHLQTFALVAILVSLGATSVEPAAGADPGRFGLVWVHPPAGVASADRIGKATDLGAKWDRFPFYWNEVQPSGDDQWEYRVYDARVAANQARGLTTQGILLGAPSWATQSGRIDYAKWSEFVRQTVTRYRGTVRYWEVWNEPDLLDGSGKGLFWSYGVSEYAALLRVTYQTIKTVDPSIVVLMGAIAFPYNNEGFLGQLLGEVAKDPAAKSSRFYFDVLPFHSYDRVARLYDLPHGYFGRPSYEGLHAVLRRHGLVKPLWVNETGVPVYDYADGKKAPGRATQDEQAAYAVQASAYALAAGVERVFFFQLYDDGAGAVDPATGRPAEYFGLVTNDGQARPAFAAYRNAVQLMDGARLVTRVNSGRSVTNDELKGVEVITFYGTSRGKVTIAWNADGGQAARLRLRPSSGSATVIDKLGVSKGTIAPTDGAYLLSLPAATNNNNFDCFTVHGCDPDDYIIGGNPVILVEADSSVPSAAFQPLPTASNAPFEVRWRPLTGAASPRYDVQIMDSVEGIWRDWLTNTQATSARFGEGQQKLQRGRTYEFRIRARDAAGAIAGADYPLSGMASTLVVGGNVLSSGNIDARIEVVWPHNGASVDKADKANVAAYLFSRDSTVSVGPNWDTMPRLYRSTNNGVEEQVAVATKRIATVNGFMVPVFEFNDVDVSAARDPRNRVFFHVGLGAGHAESNTWSHAVDSRTYFPKTDVPTAVLTGSPTAIDAKIEIVWPHNGASVDKADKVNVAAYLFEHGTTKSAPSSFAPKIRLFRSIDNGVEEEVGVGQMEIRAEGSLKFPTWQFNDVDVSAARDPKHRVFLRLSVDGVTHYTNTWAHAQDARTYFPTQDVPSGVLP
jgi:hypothetical protein